MKKAFSNFLFAPVLIIAAVSLLGWNEGRAVRTERALNEGLGSVVSLDPAELAAAGEGTLVHTTGEVTTSAPLIDPDLGVQVAGLRLSRSVEMYQWRRHSSGDEEGASEYRPEWSRTLIDSRNYPAGRENPAQMPVRASSAAATDATIGGLTLSTEVISRLSGLQSVALTAADVEAIGTRLGLEEAELAGDALYLPYGFGSATAPQIGDVRVRLEYAPAGTYSLVARRSGQLLEPFVTSGGTTIAMLRSGNYSAQAMFDQALAQNSGFTIMMRVLGFVLCFAGFRLLFSPLTALTGWVPVLGKLARSGVSIVSALLALGIGATTVVIAWLTYRPLVALPFLLICVGLIVGGIVLVRRVRAAGRASVPLTSGPSPALAD